MGRSNHERVSEVNRELKQIGYRTWFDEERMQGNIHDAMTEGIEKTKCVIVFLTKKYIEKVNGNDETDNCKLEFNYAFIRKKLIVLVVMEEEAKEAMKIGVLGMKIGAKLYIDMSRELKIGELVEQLKRQEIHLNNVKTNFLSLFPCVVKA